MYICPRQQIKYTFHHHNQITAKHTCHLFCIVSQAARREYRDVGVQRELRGGQLAVADRLCARPVVAVASLDHQPCVVPQVRATRQG